jgi:hypothetical protein
MHNDFVIFFPFFCYIPPPQCSLSCILYLYIYIIDFLERFPLQRAGYISSSANELAHGGGHGSCALATINAYGCAAMSKTRGDQVAVQLTRQPRASRVRGDGVWRVGTSRGQHRHRDGWYHAASMLPSVIPLPPMISRTQPRFLHCLPKHGDGGVLL